MNCSYWRINKLQCPLCGKPLEFIPVSEYDDLWTFWYCECGFSLTKEVIKKK